MPGGRVYTDDNNDRFGLPLRPFKPIEIVPGPGAYYLNGDGENNLVDRTYPIDEAKTFARSNRDDIRLPGRGVPGPAFYRSMKEPKKISFLFNPSEKWV